MNNFYDKYEFFPLTILDSPLETVELELKEILTTWQKDSKIEFGPVDLDKINPPPMIIAGGAHLPKFLIWEPKNNPNSTAFFSNYQDGLNSLIHVWNQRYGKRAVSIRLSNDSICDYPHHEINVKTTENEERVVYTHVASKWEFFQTGPVQEFEDTENYKAKKIKDRLNNDIVNKYLYKLGFKIWEEDFYKSNNKGIYFERLSWNK